jgi:DNA-binding Xre family transcriptional regulator
MAYRKRTGESITYPVLAERTGLSRATIESIATRKGYNASLSTLARLCGALNCKIDELLQSEGPPPRRRG